MASPIRDAGTGRKWLPALLTAALLSVLGSYLFGQRAYIVDHYALRPLPLLGIAMLVVVTLGLRASANLSLFGQLQVRAPWRDWFAVVTVNSFSNYLPLSAGLVAKAFYLKRVHAMPYSKFAVGQLALLLLIVASNGVIGFAASAALGSSGTGWIAAGFAAMIAVGSCVLLPAGAARRIAGRRFPWDAAAVLAIRRSAARVIALQIAVLFATAMMLQLGFSLGHAAVGFAACLVFSAATVLTRVVAITPGALGIREFLVGGLAVMTGFELQDAVIASTLVRVVEMAVIFALGGVFTYRLSGRVAATYASESEPDAR